MKIKFENMTGEENPILNRDFEESEIAEAFGDSLKKLREHVGMSLRELSKQVEIPNPTLSRYESGYNIPSITQGIKICEFFDMSIEAFVQFGLMAKYGVQPGDIVQSYESMQKIKENLIKAQAGETEGNPLVDFLFALGGKKED